MKKPLFKIRHEGRFGFMDADGEVAIEPQFFEVADFRNGFSKTILNDRWALLDTQGRLFFKKLNSFPTN